MAQRMKWKVVREHSGDRFYNQGDERIGTMEELGHLSGRVLELVGPADDEEPAVKKAPPHKNKAVRAAPANKAASPRKSKRSR